MMIRTASGVVAAFSLATFGLTGAASAVVLDFEGTGEFSDNFRLYSGSAVPVQQGGSVAAQGAARAVYDTTPADAAEQSLFSLTPGGPALTVTIDVNFDAEQGGSFGVFFVNPTVVEGGTHETAAYIALLNYSEGNDFIRFSSNANPNSGTSTGVGTLTPQIDGFIENDYEAGDWGQLIATYSLNSEGQAVLSMSFGDSEFITHTVAGAGRSEVGVGFRSSSFGTIGIDNFTAAVPEPASLALLSLGGVAALRRRR